MEVRRKEAAGTVKSATEVSKEDPIWECHNGTSFKRKKSLEVNHNIVKKSRQRDMMGSKEESKQAI